MENFRKHNQQDNLSQNKKGVNENFEQAAGIRIHKGKENYAGGSGYYAAKAKQGCPNANQECSEENQNQSRH